MLFFCAAVGMLLIFMLATPKASEIPALQLSYFSQCEGGISEIQNTIRNPCRALILVSQP